MRRTSIGTKLLRVCLSTCLSLGAGLSVVPVQAASKSQPVRSYWGSVVVNNKLWRRAPILTSKGSSYFGVWYFLQLLRSHGVDAAWNGHALTVVNMPSLDASSNTIVFSSKLSKAGTLSINGNAYVNVSAVTKNLGWRLSYNKKSQSLTIHGSLGTIKQVNQHPVLTTLPSHSVTRPRKTSANSRAENVSEAWSTMSGLSQQMLTIKRGGTSYIGIWYVMQWLHQHGYAARWAHNQLNVGNLPNVIHDGALVMGNTEDTSIIVQDHEDWYVPLATLMYTTGLIISVDGSNRVHVEKPNKSVPSGSVRKEIRGSIPLIVTYAAPGGGTPSGNAKVAIETSDGIIHPYALDANGTLSVSVPGTKAFIVGLYTPAQGWIGEGIPVTTASNVVNLNTVQALSSVTGRLKAMGNSEVVSGSTVVLRSDLTHAHYKTQANANGVFHMSVPAGPYEVWTVTVNGLQMFLGQRFVATAASTPLRAISLPALPANHIARGPHVVVVGEAQDVSPVQLVSVENMLERGFNYDVMTTGLNPTQPIRVQVYTSTGEYTQHFADQDYSASDSQDYGTFSQAVSEGAQDISVNMQGLSSEFGVNVIAHELFHCLIDTVSQDIPDWVNEGTAWHQGIGAQVDISPDNLLLSALQWNEWEDIVRQQKLGKLFPLDGANTLAPEYNVEAQDYFAMEQLIQRFGLAKVVAFIKRIDATGVSKAFTQTFGETESNFFAEVTALLKSDAATHRRTFSVSVKVLPGGPSYLFVSNPSGKTYWFTGAVPGQTYTFTCNANGIVSTPKGLTANPPVSSTSDNQWDIGAQAGASQGFFSINNAFGVAYIQSTSMFYGSSSTPDEEIATALPIGLQMVGITMTTNNAELGSHALGGNGTGNTTNAVMGGAAG